MIAYTDGCQLQLMQEIILIPKEEQGMYDNLKPIKDALSESGLNAIIE